MHGLEVMCPFHKNSDSNLYMTLNNYVRVLKRLKHLIHEMLLNPNFEHINARNFGSFFFAKYLSFENV